VWRQEGPGGSPAAASLSALPRTTSGSGDDGWCASQHQLGNTTVFRMAPCFEHPQQSRVVASDGQPAQHAACAADGGGAAAEAAKQQWPEVLVATVALDNNSFGLIRDQGLANKGPRGFEGFLDMLAEQVSWVIKGTRGTSLKTLGASDGP
jgi:hypothetical protein